MGATGICTAQISSSACRLWVKRRLRYLTGGAAEVLLITDAPPRDRRDCNGPKGDMNIRMSGTLRAEASLRIYAERL